MCAAARSLAQWGETPLHRAANCGNARAVAALLAGGADADAARNVRRAHIRIAHSHTTRMAARMPLRMLRELAMTRYMRCGRPLRVQDGRTPLDVASTAETVAALASRSARRTAGGA